MMLSLRITALGVWFSGPLKCFQCSLVNLHGELAGAESHRRAFEDGDSHLTERAHWNCFRFLSTLTIVYQTKPSLLLAPRPMKQNPEL